jgi:pyruvate kinase
MIARGDLGLELPIEQIGLIQKNLIRRANTAGKPVITATEMLNSMMEQPRPTRAEVTDITNAILDGTDAVMLSGESAVGEYPVEATQMMARVVMAAETALGSESEQKIGRASIEMDFAIAREACHIAHAINARLILCSTPSGRTARLISQARPVTPIIAFSSSETALQKCALLRGVHSMRVAEVKNTDSMVAQAKVLAKETGLANAGDRVVVVEEISFAKTGTAGLIQVEVL